MIYLDNNATTPIAPDVKVCMDRFTQMYGNMSSAHYMGQQMRRIYDEAVDALMQILGASGWSLYSCSSATEATNWLFYSLFLNLDYKPRVIVSSIEHPCVLLALKQYENRGVIELLECSVDSKGFVRLDELDSLLNSNTLLVSVMLANNDVGTIQPIKKIVEMASRVGALVHSDIVQSVGKMPINLNDLGVDFVTLSSHKCYAPTGLGVLMSKHVDLLKPMIFGGSQQDMLRAGSVNVFGMATFVAGVSFCLSQMQNQLNVTDWVNDLAQYSDSLAVISSPNLPNQLWNTVAISFINQNAHSMMMQLDMEGICASTGSACATGAFEPSHVILAMGYELDVASTVIRFSFGYLNTVADMNNAKKIILKLI